MNSDFTAHNPDSIEYTLTVTMNLKQWKELQSQLQSCHPSWKLSAAINDMVRQATHVFWPRIERDDE